MDDYALVPASISERYKVGRALGDGNFAVVRECVERSTGREYALKIISKDKCRGKVSLPLNLLVYVTVHLLQVLYLYNSDGVLFQCSFSFMSLFD